jgi:hypothetical protein
MVGNQGMTPELQALESDQMQDITDELMRLVDEVAAPELLKGRKLKTRSGNQFIVKQVTVHQSGHTFRFWIECSRLKADGEPHAHTILCHFVIGVEPD